MFCHVKKIVLYMQLSIVNGARCFANPMFMAREAPVSPHFAARHTVGGYREARIRGALFFIRVKMSDSIGAQLKRFFGRFH